MDPLLLQTLAAITEEEKKLLAGRTVDQQLYTDSREFTVDSAKMLQKGKLMDIRPHTRFAYFPSHRHNYIEIIYMCAGHTTHIINHNTRVTLRQGDLLFLNRNTCHEILPAEKADIAVNFIILPEFFDVALSMIPKGNILSDFLISTLCRDASDLFYLHFKVAEILPVQNLIENMVWSVVHSQNNHYRINQTTMALLFLQLLNYTDHIEQGTPPQYDRTLVLSALKDIEENYRTASLSELARQHKQSLSHYSKLISAATGTTYKELLQRRRLDKAAELLATTSLSISDVIAAVGYDNTSYFYRRFRQRFGVSPKEYRARHETAMI